MQEQRSPIIKVMMTACHKAARAILRDFYELESLQISQKGVESFVTSSDLKSEKVLIEELSRARPHYSLLLEESGYLPAVNDVIPTHRWVIDPMDGTSNFIHGNPNFAISIALEVVGQNNPHREPDMLRTGDIIAAVTYLPATKEIYWAERGKGAYYMDSANREKRIRIASRDQLKGTLVGTNIPNNTSQEYRAVYNLISKNYAKIRVSGATTVDLAFVASGKLDAAFYEKSMLWDIAGGALFVLEAGGAVHKINNIMAFGNETLIKKMLE